MTELVISDLKLIRLTMDRLGPFQAAPKQIDFFGVDLEEGTTYGAGPANLFMLLAKNAYGKTTILEAIYGLFALLDQNPQGRFHDGRFGGAAQLDIRATWTIDGASETVLLSLWYGSKDPLHDWTKSELDEVAHASTTARLGLEKFINTIVASEFTDQLGELFFEKVKGCIDIPPTDLFGLSQTFPTVLYFPADRRVSAPDLHKSVNRPDHWGYRPAMIFRSDGPEWNTSIDNLFVWLEWLTVRRADRAEDSRIDRLLEFINELLFRDDNGKRILAPNREELRTYVETRHGRHPLESLSHGERALLQILTRTLTHMTSNTIILIDEIEVHLHTRWMNRMFEAMKELLREYKALTLIFTTHNRELITVFRHREAEPGLVKGGELIEQEIE